MMPEDLSIYGGWPACGEIDIMELLGQEPNKVYGTIHYGNPHTYHGGSYTLPDGKKFSDDFHVFALEWEPGEIRWYVDSVLYYKTNDWFSRSSNEAFDYTYPAPFDREFYLILNVAIGGNWPGYPPEEANYFPQRMEVDYVKYIRGLAQLTMKRFQNLLLTQAILLMQGHHLAMVISSITVALMLMIRMLKA